MLLDRVMGSPLQLVGIVSLNPTPELINLCLLLCDSSPETRILSFAFKTDIVAAT